jgi:hypothetical protein
MTAQFTEKLILNGESFAMTSTPLGDYFVLGGNCPKLQPGSTALWRSYVGTWEVVDDRLYLIKISATLESGTPATLEHFFPGFPDRVFAHWFSGKVRLPQGELLKYVHMGFGSTYERDEFIHFKYGVMTGRHTVVNGVATPKPDDLSGFKNLEIPAWLRAERKKGKQDE